MLDLGFSDNLSKLNFIGVVSLFGGEIALSALRYTVLVQDVFLSVYFTMVLSPGLHTVSLKMFKRMDDKISRSISGGPRDNKKDIIGLSSSGSYKYIGLHSGTNMTVGNILGEALIKTCKAEEVVKVGCSRKNPPKRNLALKIIELGRLKVVENEGTSDREYGPRVHARSRPFGYRAALLYTIPLITIVGMIIVILAGDYEVFALILLNVICNMSVTFTIRGNGVRHPVGRSTPTSPPGDIFVETTEGTETYLVIADENTIQYLFQRSLIMPPNPDVKLWRYLHVLAAYTSYIMVVVNIALLPFSTVGGQIIFGVLIFFGVVQNITLSTFDGDELLFDTMKGFLKIKSTEEYIFQTRTSVLAFCMLRSKSNDVKPLTHLLPDTRTYEAWFEHVVEDVRDFSRDKAGVNHLVKHDLLDVLKMDLQDARDEHMNRYA
jgi:hypothetical protein